MTGVACPPWPPHWAPCHRRTNGLRSCGTCVPQRTKTWRTRAARKPSHSFSVDCLQPQHVLCRALPPPRRHCVGKRPSCALCWACQNRQQQPPPPSPLPHRPDGAGAAPSAATLQKKTPPRQLPLPTFNSRCSTGRSTASLRRAPDTLRPPYDSCARFGGCVALRRRQPPPPALHRRGRTPPTRRLPSPVPQSTARAGRRCQTFSPTTACRGAQQTQPPGRHGQPPLRPPPHTLMPKNNHQQKSHVFGTI